MLLFLLLLKCANACNYCTVCCALDQGVLQGEMQRVQEGFPVLFFLFVCFCNLSCNFI